MQLSRQWSQQWSRRARTKTPWQSLHRRFLGNSKKTPIKKLAECVRDSQKQYTVILGRQVRALAVLNEQKRGCDRVSHAEVSCGGSVCNTTGYGTQTCAVVGASRSLFRDTLPSKDDGKVYNSTLRPGPSAGGPNAGSTADVSIDAGTPLQRNNGTRLLRWRGRASEGWSREQPMTRTSGNALCLTMTMTMTMTHSEKSHIGQMRAWPYRQERRGHGPTKKNCVWAVDNS